MKVIKHYVQVFLIGNYENIGIGIGIGIICSHFTLYRSIDKNQYRSIFRIHTYCIKTMALCAPITYLSSENKTLCCQLCSTHYTAVLINNYLKRTYAIKVFAMKITDNFGSHHVRTYYKINTWDHST